MRMRITDGFEHFQLAGINDGDGLRAGDGREAFQEIFNGFAAFQGVNQILQGDTRADKNGRAAHDFGIGVDDAFQIFDCHNMVKIPLPAGLSSANMTMWREPAVLRFERADSEDAGFKASSLLGILGEGIYSLPQNLKTSGWVRPTTISSR